MEGDRGVVKSAAKGVLAIARYLFIFDLSMLVLSTKCPLSVQFRQASLASQ